MAGGRDAGVDNIEQFIQTLGTTVESYQNNTNKVDDLDAKVSDLEDKVEEVLDGINEDVSSFTDDFLQKHQDNLGGLDELISTLENIINGRLGDVIKTLEDIADTVDQECSNHREGTQGQFDTLKSQGYENAKEGKNQVSGTVKKKKTDAQHKFQALSKNVTGLHKDADEKHQEAQHTFSDVSDHTSNNLTENVNSSNDQFDQGLQKGLSDIVGGLGDVGGAIEDMFNLFNGGADELGTKLMDMGMKILSDTVDHIQDSLMDALKESFEKMIEEVITGLVSQIAESIVMMGVGEMVTAALGVYTPILVICRDVVEVIDKLLKALSFGL